MLKDRFFSELPVNCDLASEAHALLRGDKDIEIPGVKEEISTKKFTKITKITIINDEGARIMGRPKGQYITIDAPMVTEDFAAMEEAAFTTANAIGELVTKHISSNRHTPILICGLGNERVTADALGPEVIKKSLSTRQFFLSSPEDVLGKYRSIVLLRTDVLANTGMEAAEIIAAAANQINASAIIVIDALAALGAERLGTSFQISDCGITPGAGLGNIRSAINRETMGIPVIALGVPTVIRMSTLIDQIIAHHEPSLEHQHNNGKGDAPEGASPKEITNSILMKQREHFAVTPKDIDHVIEKAASTLAVGLHIALHQAIDQTNYHEYINV